MMNTVMIPAIMTPTTKKATGIKLSNKGELHSLVEAKKLLGVGSVTKEYM